MKRSLDFYTCILGFQMKHTDCPVDFPVIDLTWEDMELQLSTMMGNKPFGAVANVRVDEIDLLFELFVKRGLDTSAKKESPVHQGPVDQTWGIREFYVDDPDGNTLCFGKVLQSN